jgi:hypothetical protein
VCRRISKSGKNRRMGRLVIPRTCGSQGLAVPEVIPEYGSAGFQHAADLPSDIAGHAVSQDRAENGEEHRQVKVCIREVQILGVAASEADIRISPPSGFDAIPKQVYAREIVRPNAEVNQPGEDATEAPGYRKSLRTQIGKQDQDHEEDLGEASRGITQISLEVKWVRMVFSGRFP